jgi:hypothetical protein
MNDRKSDLDLLADRLLAQVASRDESFSLEACKQALGLAVELHEQEQVSGILTTAVGKLCDGMAAAADRLEELADSMDEEIALAAIEAGMDLVVRPLRKERLAWQARVRNS